MEIKILLDKLKELQALASAGKGSDGKVDVGGNVGMDDDLHNTDLDEDLLLDVLWACCFLRSNCLPL